MSSALGMFVNGVHSSTVSMETLPLDTPISEIELIALSAHYIRDHWDRFPSLHFTMEQSDMLSIVIEKIYRQGHHLKFAQMWEEQGSGDYRKPFGKWKQAVVAMVVYRTMQDMALKSKQYREWNESASLSTPLDESSESEATLEDVVEGTPADAEFDSVLSNALDSMENFVFSASKRVQPEWFGELLDAHSVLRLIVAGYTAQDLAEAFGLTTATARNIMNKAKEAFAVSNHVVLKA